MASQSDKMKKATVTMMEWTHAPVGFKLEHEGDPELDEDMSNCKWRKCGDVTCEAALNCSELGAEVVLATGCYASRKYLLVQVSDCGRYKVFTHKHEATPDVVLREVRDYVVSVDLITPGKDTYVVSFMNDAGEVGGATLEKGHNIGYASVLARQEFKVAEHAPVVFMGFSESGRCNMWKAIEKHWLETEVQQTEIRKRPAVKKQTKLLFAKKSKQM